MVETGNRDATALTKNVEKRVCFSGMKDGQAVCVMGGADVAPDVKSYGAEIGLELNVGGRSRKDFQAIVAEFSSMGVSIESLEGT